ncbi:MAG: ABC transporter ATP-binding protein/permease [Coprobacillus sp.]|nr:ABC transporter ATP-binding protein/permease [Coprobacillus sp.]
MAGTVKTLAHSIGEYKKQTIISPILMIFEVACECTIPLFVSALMNYLQDSIGREWVSEDTTYIIVVLCCLVGLAIISLLCGLFGGITAAVASSGFATNLRHNIYEKIQNFSFENIDKFQTSSLVTRLTIDINYVQMSFSMIIRMCFRAPIMVIFAIVMAFLISPTLSWIFVVLVPIMGVALYFIIVSSYRIYKQVFRKYDRLNESVEENIKGIRVVKTYVREDYETNKFNDANMDLSLGFTKADRIVAFTNPVFTFCIFAAYIAIAVMGSYAVVYTMPDGTTGAFGALGVGDLSALITYGIQMLSSLMSFSSILAMIAMSGASAGRICEVLREEPTIVNPENPVYEVKDGSIDFHNVAFKYAKEAEKYALWGVDLHIDSGMTVGILGTTGSSKTTLVNLISRLYDTTEGEVLVGGVNVKDYDLETLRDNVSVVLQRNVLFSGTILDNMRWGKQDATEEEVIAACKLACADDFITSFPDGYNTYIEQGGANVSGGQKQRLCIARALLKSPKVLILDDSTSAVDTKTDAMIRESFRQYIPSVTKIIISQRVSSIEDADMVIVMDNGTINGVGTPAEMLEKNAIYQEIYTMQHNLKGDAE